jgi:hypothetical protein
MQELPGELQRKYKIAGSARAPTFRTMQSGRIHRINNNLSTATRIHGQGFVDHFPHSRSHSEKLDLIPKGIRERVSIASYCTWNDMIRREHTGITRPTTRDDIYYQ